MTSRFSQLFPFAALLFGLAFVACEEDAPPQDPGTPGDAYTQYGTPFEALPKNEDIVLYEVNLRAFSPSGDLQGVIGRLDSIKNLGVNVLWLMPIYPVGTVNSINSPYCIKDFKAVGSEYGSLGDLRQLSDAAHARGMAVMLDWVANHTAWDHPWTQKPGWHSRDAAGNIIHPPGTNWLDVAELNYNNADMRAAMIDAMRYWVLEANIDGFRCDHADGVPFDFWQTAIGELRDIPGRELIFFAEGTRADHFEAGFDLNFGWAFYGALKAAFIDGGSASALLTAQQNEYANTPAGKHWVRFTTNHDESAWDATPPVLFGQAHLSAFAAALFMGGVPLVYGSQEVGQEANVPFFSNSSIDWSANPGIYGNYKILLNFYAASRAARSGALSFHLVNDGDILCFFKRLGTEEVLVIINLRDAPTCFDLPAPANGAWTFVQNGATASLSGSTCLGPYACFVYHRSN